MGRLFIAPLFLIFLVAFSPHARAQNAVPNAPAAQVPNVLQPPPDFPDFIVTPREDLDNYGLSTMSESEDIEYRDGAGTLGTTEKRRSNLDVNAELQRKRLEREKARQKPEEEKKPGTQNKGSVGKPSLGKDSGDKTFSPGVKRGLFTWTDENGVLHATNNLGHVPIEYQMKALENSKDSLNIKKKTDNK